MTTTNEYNITIAMKESDMNEFLQFIQAITDRHHARFYPKAPQINVMATAYPPINENEGDLYRLTMDRDTAQALRDILGELCEVDMTEAYAAFTKALSE